MTTLMNLIKKQTSRVYTENYDTSFDTTLNANLDFFASCGSLRNNQKEVERKMCFAMNEDFNLSILNMIHLRDVRSGLGERDSFRTAYKVLAKHNPEVAIKLLPVVVEYGRFDDVLVLLEERETRKEVVAFLSAKLEEDLDAMKKGDNVSLCAKWMPSINTSSEKTKRKAKIIIKELGISEKEYRLLLSVLRSYIDIIEKRLSAKDYTFDYSKIPSKALMRYTEAFRRNDKERYEAFKEKVTKGEIKTKTSVVYPHEIINLQDKELMEAMWRDLNRKKGEAKTIVVRDGSGSMTWNGFGRVKPLDIATSLSILFSEQLTGEFENKFITFSSKPKLVDLSSCVTLEEKIDECNRYTEVANTNIMAVYKLILDAEKKCEPKDYIERIVIISDMQFDKCADDVPTYETAKEMFEEAGIPLPEIVFWNVASRADFPTQDLKHIKLVSGSSQYIIQNIIDSKEIDAISFMHETLKKYEHILEIIK